MKLRKCCSTVESTCHTRQSAAGSPSSDPDRTTCGGRCAPAIFGKCAGEKFWLWRAVDQHGTVLEEILHKRRDKRAAKLRAGGVNEAL
ncbi:DDE-type integrase/transposase/recombinase [Rhizobium laguerreae]